MPTFAPSSKPSESPSGKPSSSPSNAPSDSPSELQCEVDSYLLGPGTETSRCERCDGTFTNYGTSTCGIVGATHMDQCKYPIGMCVFDLVSNMMVFAKDIPEIGQIQTANCYKEALDKGGCAGMFYDPRDDCPDAVDNRGIYTKEGFDACNKARCIWTKEKKKTRMVQNDFVFHPQ